MQTNRTRYDDDPVHLLTNPMDSPIISSPELELVFTTVRFDGKQDQHIRDLLNGDLDWDQVLQIAINHEILPFVHKKLMAFKTVPGQDGNEKLRKVYLENVTRNIFLTRTLIQVLDLFSREKISAIALKGPAFAKLAYGDLAMRQISDLDIFIHIQDFERAYQVLVSSNWTPEILIKPREKKWLLRSAYELPFHRNGKYLELHWGIAETGVTQSIEIENWWQKLQYASLLDVEVPTLSAENTFLYLCLHGTRHGWYKLKYILDLAQYINAYHSLNWSAILDLAHRANLNRSLAIAVLLVNKYCSTSFPPIIHQSCAPDQTTLQLVKNTEEKLLSRNPTITDMQIILTMLRSRDKFRDRLYFALDRIFVPKQTDWLPISLPSAFEPLYYVFRPARLILKFGREFLIKKFDLL